MEVLLGCRLFEPLQRFLVVSLCSSGIPVALCHFVLSDSISSGSSLQVKLCRSVGVGNDLGTLCVAVLPGKCQKCVPQLRRIQVRHLLHNLAVAAVAVGSADGELLQQSQLLLVAVSELLVAVLEAGQLLILLGNLPRECPLQGLDLPLPLCPVLLHFARRPSDVQKPWETAGTLFQAPSKHRVDVDKYFGFLQVALGDLLLLYPVVAIPHDRDQRVHADHHHHHDIHSKAKHCHELNQKVLVFVKQLIFPVSHHHGKPRQHG
mmetsp:Transcript_17309/g.33751  ORF Transcript_17309/g.33751 Transcript_17309/m.33751 type:complete len:263 (-) Transcript_17309:2422-3210(-)